MKVIGGSFNGTGAALYLCLGFVPDKMWFLNMDDPGSAIIWTKYFNETDNIEGLHFEYGVATQNELTVAAGVRQYYGGTVLSASAAGTTTYGEGVYLKHQPRDYRYGAGLGPSGRSGDAVAETINTWTLDNATNRTGHFNEDVTGTYIGEGSPICIDGKWYRILTLTATQGEAANEVTLNFAAPSGSIQYIGGRYGEWVPMIAGEITKDGILINEITNLNANNEKIVFEAWQYDN